MGIFIEKSRGERTGDASTILFPNYVQSVQKQELIEKAKSFKEGSMVSWNSSGGTARGKIVHIMREGVLGVPDSKFKINAQPDDPAVLIQIYRDGEETETFVGHKMSTLSGASSMSKESPTMNTVHVDSVMGGKKKKKKAMDANGVEIEIEVDGEEEDEEEEVEMAMGGYGYDMSEKPKKKVTKHAMHDQQSHGSWAGGGGSGSGGSGSDSGKFKRESQKRPVSSIAREIKNDPAYQKMPSKIYAEAYVQPMLSLNDIEDNYGMDTGVSIVSYALSNLGSYKGDTARRVKSELKAMLKPNKGKTNNFIAQRPSMDEPQYIGNEGIDFDSGQGRFI
jgi:hypothetical protein